MTRAYRVHFDAGGQTRCGKLQAALTTDPGNVTCLTCLNLLQGTHHVGVRPADLKPCGTMAAYRRHYRYGQRPCQACQQARERWRQDTGYYQQRNQARRQRYATARATGSDSGQARQASVRRAA